MSYHLKGCPKIKKGLIPFFDPPNVSDERPQFYGTTHSQWYQVEKTGATFAVFYIFKNCYLVLRYPLWTSYIHIYLWKLLHKKKFAINEKFEELFCILNPGIRRWREDNLGWGEAVAQLISIFHLPTRRLKTLYERDLMRDRGVYHFFLSRKAIFLKKIIRIWTRNSSYL